MEGKKTKNATVAVDIESPIRDVRKNYIFIVLKENNNLISSTQLSSHLEEHKILLQAYKF